MPLHVRPRDAASVIVVRPDASGALTVLMGRRSRRAAFVPSYQIAPMAMPGGAGLGAVGQW